MRNLKFFDISKNFRFSFFFFSLNIIENNFLFSIHDLFFSFCFIISFKSFFIVQNEQKVIQLQNIFFFTFRWSWKKLFFEIFFFQNRNLVKREVKILIFWFFKVYALIFTFNEKQSFMNNYLLNLLTKRLFFYFISRFHLHASRFFFIVWINTKSTRNHINFHRNFNFLIFSNSNMSFHV